MQVFSIFEQCTSLELAISKLEVEGISRSNIYAVPVLDDDRGMSIFDSIYDTDGISLIDKAFVFGTAFAVIGGSIGFRLTLGPIFWGVISCVIGLLLGFFIDYYKTKKQTNKKRLPKQLLPLVILIINCKPDQVNQVKTILYENKAIGVNTPKEKRSAYLQSE